MKDRVDHLFVGVGVRDFKAALEWYGRFFGRAADVDVHESESMWQVAGTGWIYVVGDAARAGKALITLLVGDLDAMVTNLAERGITASAIETKPGLYRKALVTDPDGNVISLGEALSSAKAEGRT